MVLFLGRVFELNISTLKGNKTDIHLTSSKHKMNE